MSFSINPRSPVFVSRATATLPQGTTGALFSIEGGPIILDSIIGRVTTAIENQANNTQLLLDPDSGGSNVALCTVLDIDNDAVGTLYGITGDPTDAMVGTLDMIDAPTEQLVLNEGDIILSCAASNTGSIEWSLLYRPLSEDSRVVSA